MLPCNVNAIGFLSSANLVVTFDPANKSTNITLSNGSLTATGINTTVFDSVRATLGRTEGKWEWEYSNCSTNSIVGIVNNSHSFNNVYIGQDANGIGYYGLNGNRFRNGSAAYGSTFAPSDSIKIRLDIANNAIEFFRNNVSQGVITGLPSGILYPAWSTDGAAGIVAFGTINLGASTFAHAIGSAYQSYDGSQSG